MKIAIAAAVKDILSIPIVDKPIAEASQCLPKPMNAIRSWHQVCYYERLSGSALAEKGGVVAKVEEY
jgi:hypothetical protein